MSPLKIHRRSALGVVPRHPTPSGFKPLKINHSRLQCQNWNWQNQKPVYPTLSAVSLPILGKRQRYCSLLVSQWLSSSSAISSFHPVPVSPAYITPDHRHLWQRASCFPPGRRNEQSVGLQQPSHLTPWRWIWAEIFPVSGIWLLLILSFWHCFGACSLYRIR